MPIAVIAFDFDPLLRLGDTLVVRWQTVALAAVIAAALVVAGAAGRRAGLRADDLLFIAVGIVPGAVIGGRVGFALQHLDLVTADPWALLDPSVGGLELGLGVAGGLVTAAYVARLLDAPSGRWSHVAALPVLFVLGAGKLTMVLGGAGQGEPSGATWATAFLGPGPWGSLAPRLPSVPSQALEGIATLAIAVLLALALMAGAFRSRDGRALFLGLAGWAIARAVVSTTWRDPAVLGPLPVGGVIAAVLAVAWLALAAWRTARPEPVEAAEAPLAEAPSWPDPAERPPF